MVGRPSRLTSRTGFGEAAWITGIAYALPAAAEPGRSLWIGSPPLKATRLSRALRRRSGGSATRTRASARGRPSIPIAELLPGSGRGAAHWVRNVHRRVGCHLPMPAQQGAQACRALEGEEQLGARQLDDGQRAGNRVAQPVRPLAVKEDVGGTPDDEG